MPGYRFLFSKNNTIAARVAFAFCALIFSARFAYAESTITVLGLANEGVPNEIAQQLTDNLRLRAGSTPGIVPVDGKDLIEMKLVFDCETEAPACIAQAGKSLGADKVLYGTIKKLPGKNGGYSAELRLIDVRTASIDHAVHERLGKNDLNAAAASTLAGRWWSALVDVDAKPSLVVMSDPSNAALTIDGAPAGRTPATLRDLAPGSHTITLSMNGRAPVSRSVELRPGNSMEIVVPLQQSERAAPAAAVVVVAPPAATAPTEEQPARTEHPGRTAIIIGSTFLVASLACGIVNAVAYTSYSNLENDIASGKVKANIKDPNDPVIAQGDSKAALSTGMAVAWPLLAVAGGTALGIGIYQHRQGHRTTSSNAWWFVPTASPQAVGIAGGVHF